MRHFYSTHNLQDPFKEFGDIKTNIKMLYWCFIFQKLIFGLRTQLEDMLWGQIFVDRLQKWKLITLFVQANTNRFITSVFAWSLGPIDSALKDRRNTEWKMHFWSCNLTGQKVRQLLKYMVVQTWIFTFFPYCPQLLIVIIMCKYWTRKG